MLQIASTVSVNLTTGAVSQSDPILSRNSLASTLTGTGSLVVGNMRAALYRLNRNGIDGTLCAQCSSFSGPANAFLGAMDLDTAQTLAAFTAMEGVRQWEKARFSLLVYDASTNQYLTWEDLDVSYDLPLTAETPPNVSPITSGTTSWGNLRLYNGALYIYNETDGLYDPLTAAGAGDTDHLNLGAGIPL